MNKLLQHIMNAGDVSDKFLVHFDNGVPLVKKPLVKAQKGIEYVTIDGKRMRTDSSEYKNLYNQGIGRWMKKDTAGNWMPGTANDPDAEFISSPKTLDEVAVSARPRTRSFANIPPVFNNASRGDMASYFPQIQRMKDQPQIEQVREEANQRELYNRLYNRQGEIRQAEAPRSAGSKLWSLLTSPATAFSYAVQGRRRPEYFDRDRNKIDMALDIINPFAYINAAKNAIEGTGRVAMNPSTILEEAPGIALNTLGALPLVGEVAMGTNYLAPAFRAGRSTFAKTADLAFKPRLRNALNSASLELDNFHTWKDVPSHSFFNMTPDEVKTAMDSEMKNLPKGAFSMDKNMSKNSAPLYWTTAARNPGGYTFVRTGENQALNWAGTHGKRIAQAIPKNAQAYVPEIQEITNAVRDRISYLKQLDPVRYADEIARLEKEGVSSAIVGELRDMAYNSPQGRDFAMQFMRNYKPTLDAPIMQVNKNTGLNFPMTMIDDAGTIPEFIQPTIVGVKGNPLTDRAVPALKDYFKKRAERLYLGDMFKDKSPFSGTSNWRVPSWNRGPLLEMLKGNSSTGSGYSPSGGGIVLKKGGPIVDPFGQWAHPGERTIVPTSDGRITMEGVSYPVYGQDETGYAQMMYPGGEYQFPGQIVDEIPIAKSGGQHGGLDRWFAEKWVDVKTGKPCGRQEGESRAYPACRPSRRVSSETPKTSSEMSPAEKAKFKRTKTSSERIPYNHKKAQWGQQVSSQDSVRNIAGNILKYEQLKGGPGGTPLPQYSDPKYMQMLMQNIYPEIKKILPNASAMEAGEAMDFVFNAGWDQSSNKITKDPRAYALQEYYRQYDPSKLDAEGKWSGRKNPAYSFDQEYTSTVGKLSENQRRVLMNRGRDWYYRNINNPAPGVPNSNYYDTWFGRIWNTNEYAPFNPNNPKFIYKKK